MMQNLGSKPKINCKMVIDTMITIGFLYFRKKDFIDLVFE